MESIKLFITLNFIICILRGCISNCSLKSSFQYENKCVTNCKDNNNSKL